MSAGALPLNQFAPSIFTIGGAQSLYVNIGAGSAITGPQLTQFTSTVVGPLPKNTTSYIYLDLNHSVMAVTYNTTGFTGTVYPIAVAVTNPVQIITLTDVRGAAYAYGVH